MIPTVVSFHTGDAAYPAAAEALRQSCEQHHMPHLIARVPDQGTWIENVSLKGRFLWHVMRRLRRPLLWVDADGVLKARPELLFDCEMDFGIFAKDRRRFEWRPIGRKTQRLPELWPRKFGGKWFLTGTVFINATLGGMTLLEEWAKASKNRPRDYQQLLLQEIWCQTRPNTFWLPDSYCAVRGKCAGSPVIIHDFLSTKLKGVVRS